MSRDMQQTAREWLAILDPRQARNYLETHLILLDPRANRYIKDPRRLTMLREAQSRSENVGAIKSKFTVG
jgi:hypothetical protein